MTILPPYSDVSHLTQEYKSQSGSVLVVGDAMSLQLLPNASSSSSASSASSSTWRPLTSTTELSSSTQRSAATIGPRNGNVPPAAWPDRPLPALPTSLDGDDGLALGDELTTVPRLDRDRLQHVDSLGAGHFGEVSRFSVQTSSFPKRRIMVLQTKLFVRQLLNTSRGSTVVLCTQLTNLLLT